MNHARRLLLALGCALAPALAWAAMTSSPSGIDDRLRLEWEAVAARGNRVAVEGYLYNDYKRIATNVVITIETLDASGQVTARTISILPGIVPPFGRTYFDIPLKSAGASYRIAVTSFEWYAGGASRQAIAPAQPS